MKTIETKADVLFNKFIKPFHTDDFNIIFLIALHTYNNWNEQDYSFKYGHLYWFYSSFSFFLASQNSRRLQFMLRSIHMERYIFKVNCIHLNLKELLKYVVIIMAILIKIQFLYSQEDDVMYDLAILITFWCYNKSQID